MKVFTYSFKTFPDRNFLNSLPVDCIFNKLNEDFGKFSKQIYSIKPDLILGIAHQADYSSQFESFTTNSFNKTKKIIRNGPDRYNLFVPKDTPINFKVSSQTTHSFCNWTMYKISHFITENKLPTKIAFTHIATTDLSELTNWLTKQVDASYNFVFCSSEVLT